MLKYSEFPAGPSTACLYIDAFDSSQALSHSSCLALHTVGLLNGCYQLTPSLLQGRLCEQRSLVQIEEHMVLNAVSFSLFTGCLHQADGVLNIGFWALESHRVLQQKVCMQLCCCLYVAICSAAPWRAIASSCNALYVCQR